MPAECFPPVIFTVLASATDGKVYSWGDQEYGGLGNGASGSSNQTVAARLKKDASTNFDNAKWISAGYSHSFIVDTSNNLWATGRNHKGQLGTSGTLNYSYATQVLDQCDAGRSWELFSGGAGCRRSPGMGRRRLQEARQELGYRQHHARNCAGIDRSRSFRHPQKSVPARDFSAAALTSGGNIYAWGP